MLHQLILHLAKSSSPAIPPKTRPMGKTVLEEIHDVTNVFCINLKKSVLDWLTDWETHLASKILTRPPILEFSFRKFLKKWWSIWRWICGVRSFLWCLKPLKQLVRFSHIEHIISAPLVDLYSGQGDLDSSYVKIAMIQGRSNAYCFARFCDISRCHNAMCGFPQIIFNDF